MLIRNDDVAFDTNLDDLERFCKICDKYGFKIIQAITVIGEVQKISRHDSNEKIRGLSGRLVTERPALLNYLKERGDLIGVHGLWHTHQPTSEEIDMARGALEQQGLNVKFFVPPFNEGEYGEPSGLLTSKLGKRERLEEHLDKPRPDLHTMYLHSWRFPSIYSFEALEECLKRWSHET